MQEKNPIAITFGYVTENLVARFPKLAYLHFLEAAAWGAEGQKTFDADELEDGLTASNDYVSLYLYSILLFSSLMLNSPFVSLSSEPSFEESTLRPSQPTTRSFSLTQTRLTPLFSLVLVSPRVPSPSQMLLTDLLPFLVSQVVSTERPLFLTPKGQETSWSFVLFCLPTVLLSN